jgi:hypothetical protein
MESKCSSGILMFVIAAHRQVLAGEQRLRAAGSQVHPSSVPALSKRCRLHLSKCFS